MAATRETVFVKLDQFLNGKISQQELYQWMLAQVMDENYDETASKDEVLRETVQVIINFNHTNIEQIPTRKDLLFYKKCLDNQEQFETFEDRWARTKKEEAYIKKGKTPPKEKDKKKEKELFVVTSRVYVSLFALSIFFIYVIGIIKPDLFHTGKNVPSQMQILRESLPHLIYSIFLLLPMRTLAQGALYYIALTVFVIGAVFYWWVSVSIVLSYELHVMLFIFFAPFTGLPATLAIWILMSLRNKYFKF